MSALVLMVSAVVLARDGRGRHARHCRGLLGGLIANRVRGVYFALITFGMAQVVAKVVYNTRALGASDGLIGVPVIDIDLGVVGIERVARRLSSSSSWPSSSCSMPSRPICSTRRSAGC